MYVHIVWTVVVLGVLLTTASVWVLISRLVADRTRAYRMRAGIRMQECLRQALLRAVSDAKALEVLRSNRGVAMDALVQTSSALPAAARPRLSRLFRELGLVDRALAGLRHRRWSERLQAANLLGFMGDPTVIPALVRSLDDEMLDVRLAAGRALAQLRASSAVEPILHALAVPGDLSLKLAADVLTEYGETAVPSLLRFLLERKVGTAVNAATVAATVLGLSRHEGAVPMLIDLLADPEPELRVNAARALGLVGGRRAVAALCEHGTDPVWQVRSGVAQALGRAGDPSVVPVLTRLLPDPAWWVRWNAALALSRLGEAGRETLVRARGNHVDRFARDISREVLEWRAPDVLQGARP
jgi:HEAT repeat protein